MTSLSNALLGQEFKVTIEDGKVTELEPVGEFDGKQPDAIVEHNGKFFAIEHKYSTGPHNLGQLQAYCAAGPLGCRSHTKTTIVVPDDLYDEMVEALGKVGLTVTTVLRGGRDTRVIERIPEWFRSQV